MSWQTFSGLSSSWSTSNVEIAVFDLTHVHEHRVQQRQDGEAPDRVAKGREFVGSRSSRYPDVGEYNVLISDGLRSAINLHLGLSGYLVLYELTCKSSTRTPLRKPPSKLPLKRPRKSRTQHLRSHCPCLVGNSARTSCPGSSCA